MLCSDSFNNGGLVTKAGLDYLPTSTLYGALLSIASSLEADEAVKEQWTKIGKARLDQEQTDKHAVILKFEQEPSNEIRKVIRNHGLKWNKLRCEWYGYCHNIDSLKIDLGAIKYQIEEF